MTKVDFFKSVNVPKSICDGIIAEFGGWKEFKQWVKEKGDLEFCIHPPILKDAQSIIKFAEAHHKTILNTPLFKCNRGTITKWVTDRVPMSAILGDYVGRRLVNMLHNLDDCSDVEHEVKRQVYYSQIQLIGWCYLKDMINVLKGVTNDSV